MRKLFRVDRVLGNNIFRIGSKQVKGEDVVKLGYLYDEDGYSYPICEPLIDYVPVNTIKIKTSFGIVEVNSSHKLYVEVPETPTLESIALKWGIFFLEDTEEVNMSQKEHKEFARECELAGISALAVFEYLNI